MSIIQVQPPSGSSRASASTIGDTAQHNRSEKRQRWSWIGRTLKQPKEIPANLGARKEFFDRVYRADRDPWNCEGGYYERAKRGTMIGALPRKHYGHALDLGCSTGALECELSRICDEVLGVDISEVALEHARHRDYANGNVDFVTADLPREWPEGRYDLIVLSDILYFLSTGEIRQLARLVVRSLNPSGEFVLVNWRGETGLPLSGADAAACFKDTVAEVGRFSQVVEEAHDGYVLEIFKNTAGMT